MKIMTALLVVLLLFSGCSSSGDYMDGALVLRNRITSADVCSFDAVITADYGDVVHTFSVTCRSEKDGKLEFTVRSPDSISGITGYFDMSGGNLTFSDKVLAFPMLAEGELSPVSAPWLFLKTLRGGCIVSTGQDGDKILLCIDESYEENVLSAHIWMDSAFTPLQCDFIWGGRRILSMEIENFSCV